MSNGSPRRRRLRARPLLVAVGTIALAGTTGACGTPHGVVACQPEVCGGGGSGGIGGSTGGDGLDMAVPTEADLKPSSSD